MVGTCEERGSFNEKKDTLTYNRKERHYEERDTFSG